MKYKNILLIDDDEDDREIFLSAVNDIPGVVNCTVFSDAAMALEKLVKKEINPELIFLDMNMPVMNGKDFLVALKKHKSLSQIPVNIFSTCTNNNYIKFPKESGANEYITKPDKYSDLVNILSRILL